MTYSLKFYGNHQRCYHPMDTAFPMQAMTDTLSLCFGTALC